MFGLSKQERLIDVLVRSTTGVMEGWYYEVGDISELGLNKAATKEFLLEGEVLQIYIMGVAFKNKVGPNNGWATPQFFVKTVSDALSSIEIDKGFPPGAASQYIFSRCSEIDNMSGEERGNNSHLLESAKRIAEHDSSVDVYDIVDVFDAISKFMFDKMMSDLG